MQGTNVQVERADGEVIAAVVSESSVPPGTLLFEAAECNACQNMSIESCPSRSDVGHAQVIVKIAGGEPLAVTRLAWRKPSSPI